MRVGGEQETDPRIQKHHLVGPSTSVVAQGSRCAFQHTTAITIGVWGAEMFWTVCIATDHQVRVQYICSNVGSQQRKTPPTLARLVLAPQPLLASPHLMLALLAHAGCFSLNIAKVASTQALRREFIEHSFLERVELTENVTASDSNSLELWVQGSGYRVQGRSMD